MKAAGVGLLIALLLLVMVPSVVAAQDPTPTPTMAPSPTPSHLQGVPLSTGTEMQIQKTVTWGDVAIVISVLVLAAVQLVKTFVVVPKGWFPHNER